MKSDDILKRTQELLGAKASEKEAMKNQLESERRMLVSSIGKEIAQLITPALEQMAKANQVTLANMRDMISQIQIEVPQAPEVNIPPITVPRPVVNITTPEVKIPQINVPESKISFPESMSVTMDSVDRSKPLPVLMMGTDGKPMSFSMGAGCGVK